MDGSVVNVALPTLQSTFRATSAAIQWVVQGYALFGAALLLFGGAIGDRYGRRRTFLWGVALFALASAACAVSLSLGQLIAARGIQGVGAALLIPQGLAILSASFPEEERGRAIGTWSAWTTVFAAIGPVVGGWLIQAYSWRLIFLLNLPVVLVIMLLAPRIPESRAAGDGVAQPLDRLGAALATLSFAGIIYALSFASQFGWRNSRVIWPLLRRARPFGVIPAFPVKPAQRHDAPCALPHTPLPGGEPAHFSPVRGFGGLAVCHSFLFDPGAALPSSGGGRRLCASHRAHVPVLGTGGSVGAQVGRASLALPWGGAGRGWICRLRLARHPARIPSVSVAPGPYSGLRNDALCRSPDLCCDVFGAGKSDRDRFGGEQCTFPASRAGGCIPARPAAGSRICDQSDRPACPLQLAGRGAGPVP